VSGLDRRAVTFVRKGSHQDQNCSNISKRLDMHSQRVVVAEQEAVRVRRKEGNDRTYPLEAFYHIFEFCSSMLSSPSLSRNRNFTLSSLPPGSSVDDDDRTLSQPRSKPERRDFVFNRCRSFFDHSHG